MKTIPNGLCTSAIIAGLLLSSWAFAETKHAPVPGSGKAAPTTTEGIRALARSIPDQVGADTGNIYTQLNEATKDKSFDFLVSEGMDMAQKAEPRAAGAFFWLAYDLAHFRAEDSPNLVPKDLAAAFEKLGKASAGVDNGLAVQAFHVAGITLNERGDKAGVQRVLQLMAGLPVSQARDGLVNNLIKVTGVAPEGTGGQTQPTTTDRIRALALRLVSTTGSEPDDNYRQLQEATKDKSLDFLISLGKNLAESGSRRAGGVLLDLAWDSIHNRSSDFSNRASGDRVAAYEKLGKASIGVDDGLALQSLHEAGLGLNQQGDKPGVQRILQLMTGMPASEDKDKRISVLVGATGMIVETHASPPAAGPVAVTAAQAAPVMVPVFPQTGGVTSVPITPAAAASMAIVPVPTASATTNEIRALAFSLDSKTGDDYQKTFMQLQEATKDKSLDFLIKQGKDLATQGDYLSKRAAFNFFYLAMDLIGNALPKDERVPEDRATAYEQLGKASKPVGGTLALDAFYRAGQIMEERGDESGVQKMRELLTQLPTSPLRDRYVRDLDQMTAVKAAPAGVTPESAGNADMDSRPPAFSPGALPHETQGEYFDKSPEKLSAEPAPADQGQSRDQGHSSEYPGGEHHPE